MAKAEFEKKFVNQIICGDCLEVMKDWPDNCVDLVLTDPPYGINYNNSRLRRYSNAIYSDIDGDETTMDFGFLFSRPEPKIVFGALNFLEQIPYKGRWICWDKRTTELADGVFGSPFELAWLSKRTGYDKIYRVMHGGVINADGANQSRFHPTQKPVLLFIKILKDFSIENNLVLDPFCGSGTTCIAAKMLGRRYIGIDISGEYCEIARMRLKAVETSVPVAEQKIGQKGLWE